jgi:glyoxylase-like metal-dependent hydrolase (beta-lactamase superfamily II)
VAWQRVRLLHVPLPTGINYIKIAESHRPLSDVIVGGSQQDYVSARTAFQVLFPDGSIMIDSGMDETVHKFFGFGRVEPYWPERNAVMQQALKSAKLIVITHEHGDHVAGVIRTDSREEIAAKTLMTRVQVQTLTTANPQNLTWQRRDEERQKPTPRRAVTERQDRGQPTFPRIQTRSRTSRCALTFRRAITSHQTAL